MLAITQVQLRAIGSRVARATRVLAAAVALAAGAIATAHAEPVSAADTRAVRAVVEAQLKAFAADDASTAFSYAAPSIRQMFGDDAERFMAMVRGNYPVVYRPSGIVFLQPERVGDVLVQNVQMTDAAGLLWLAVYNLERQADRSWRITGCAVQAQTGRIT